MAPRFDPESLRLDLSVADLLESPFLRSLGFSSRGGYERLWLGQAIHGRYQEQKLAEDPSYRREVVISHVFEHRGWKVTVQGRADGLRREPDGSLVVEEIKSVRRGGALPPAVRESYQRQALLYAWMLSHTEPSPVSAELVLDRHRQRRHRARSPHPRRQGPRGGRPPPRQLADLRLGGRAAPGRGTPRGGRTASSSPTASRAPVRS